MGYRVDMRGIQTVGMGYGVDMRGIQCSFKPLAVCVGWVWGMG